MAEKIFFEQDDLLVTNSRFKVGNETYIIRNITSVKVNVIPGKKGQPAVNMSVQDFWFAKIFICILFVIIGLLTAVIFIGYVIFWLGIVVLFLDDSSRNTLAIPDEPDTHELILKTAGGEIKALVTKNKVLIDYLVNALNDAFSYGS